MSCDETVSQAGLRGARSGHAAAAVGLDDRVDTGREVWRPASQEGSVRRKPLMRGRAPWPR
jgi:hypothetical protein